MEDIDLGAVEKNLLLKKSGVENYVYIMKNFKLLDVSNDSQFQKIYNYFYRLRLPSSDYYPSYYSFMENNKNNGDLTYEIVLTYLCSITGRVEASFSSKLLHTINPNMPILDANVLSQLCMKLNTTTSVNKLQVCINTYNKLCFWYENYLNTSNAKKVIEIFDNLYPNLDITDVKKIDFALWSLGVKK